MSTHGLAAQQAALAALLRRSASLAGDPAATAVATEIAAGNARLSPAQQVDIYREQFLLRHVDVLRDDFASLVHLLGDEPFRELAHAYLGAHPPRSFTLRDLGHGLARFVAEQGPWRDDPLLADLARVEWAFVEAFDAPALPLLDPRDLAAIPEEAWPRVTLTLQPAVQRVALTFPAHEYRLAVRSDAQPARPSARASCAVVYRGRDALQCLELERNAYALLDELARGTPLGEACEVSARTSGASLDTFEAALGGWFQQWTSLGWIARVDVVSLGPEA
jgi:hypothetical protein